MHSDIEWFQAENAKVKQHYKELFDLVKVTRDNNNEKITSLQNEIVNLKAQVKGKMLVTNCNCDVPNVSACGKYDIYTVSVSRPLKNNKLTHYGYLTHLKNSLDMLRETVEEDRIVKPHDSVVIDACFLTKRS